jgi:hypothetical protein
MAPKRRGDDTFSAVASMSEKASASPARRRITARVDPQDHLEVHVNAELTPDAIIDRDDVRVLADVGSPTKNSGAVPVRPLRRDCDADVYTQRAHVQRVVSV